MSLINLPQYIINKIFLYNIHPVAEILKEKIKQDLNLEIILKKLNQYGTYHFVTLTEMQKNTISLFLNGTKYINRWEFCCERGIECIKDSDYESMYDGIYTNIDNF